ncbi:MAG: TRAP transporter substrate-binding protein [Betaproteobacteria bacterium]|jgi:TRAP-type mannitol/chloroaromatic compound transport system substrate-binding protein|nr:TRAP transporter substrate-binding protein [Betaproteobacteria bacterium]
MKTSISLKVLVAAGAAVILAAAATDASAQKRVKWKMQSAFGSTLPHLGTSGVRFEKNVAEATDGRFEIKFYEPGALVPALECFDAASKGSVDACWTTPGYHTGKIPAAAFFTTMPFGPGFGEFMAWKMYGGGDKLRNEIYAPYGLIGFNGVAIGPETSGWFKNEIKSLDQIKGMKMRFFGLGARVMQKLGVSTQLLAAADIYPALERGVIDATEFSMPSIDQKLGFYQIAKNNYFPGWHQQVSVNEFLVNKKAYDALPKNYKMILQLALGESVMATYAETEWRNPVAMNENAEKYGVHNRRWTDEELATFEKAWNEVMAEESAKDPTFKKVADSYLAFRKTYKAWGDAQAMKPTYLP